MTMKRLLKRLKSKSYHLNTTGAAIMAYVVANPAVFGITGPQGIAALAVLNIIVRELTKKPVDEK